MSDGADTDARPRGGKSATAFRTISEVSTDLDVPQHVLRFWETKFPQIKPLKRGGGRRYYRPDDVELLRRIQVLLYKEGYTIKGVQRLLKENRGLPPVGEAAPVPAAPPEATEATEAVPDQKPPTRPPTPPDRGLFDEPEPPAAAGSAESSDARPAPLAEHAAAGGVSPDARRQLQEILDELQKLSRILKG